MKSQKPNQRVHLLITIIAPTVILSQLSSDDALGQVRSVIVAFALPLGYGIWDRYVRRDWDLLAGLGMLSVLLTGGIALLELPAQYLVIKEAAIPLLIGIIVAISILMGQSLIDKLLWTVIDQETLNSRVSDQRHQVESAFRTV
jgi:intracellular septation protein A